MSTTYLGPGEDLEFTAPSGGVVAGTPVLIGGLLVVPAVTVAQTLPFRGKCLGIHSGTKPGSQAWVEGAVIYWDDSAKKFTTTSASNFRVGCAAAAVDAGAGSTTGTVRFNGVAVTVVGGAAP